MSIFSKTKPFSQHILFVGGGFVCSKAIKTLLKNRYNPSNITLITKDPYLLFTPLLVKVAANKIHNKACLIPMQKYLGNKIKIIIEEVIEINLQDKFVETKSERFSYDILVIGTGSKINLGNISGIENYSLNLKTYENVLKIRSLVQKINSAIVIGAGITGIEISAELADSKILTYLITNTNELAPYLPKNSRIYIQKTLEKKGVRIIKNWQSAKLEPNKLINNNNEFIEADLIINAIGVLPNYPQITPNPPTDKKERILVNNYMQIENFPNVFVGGDLACGDPMDAQAAWYHGGLIAKNILQFIKNKPLKKRNYKQIGNFISLGDKCVIVRMGPVVIRGLLGWILWQVFYFYKIFIMKKSSILL